MTREICSVEIYFALFCYCYQLLFQPRTPVLQSKPPSAFQIVNNNEGLCNIFPYKKEQRKPSKGKMWWKTCILVHLNAYTVISAAISRHRYLWVCLCVFLFSLFSIVSGSFSSIFSTIFFSLHHFFHTISPKDVIFTLFGFLE